jgi:hypothetical protein
MGDAKPPIHPMLYGQDALVARVKTIELMPGTKKIRVGGASRDRTDDPLLAKQVLSQLSYGPVKRLGLVGLGRVELPTSPLSGVRSNQLSYRPGNS